jgi:uncharacterized protein
MMRKIDPSGWVRLVVLVRALAGCSGETAAEQPEPEPAPATPAVLLGRHAEDVSFTSADLELEGTLLVPERASDQRLPTVIRGHGSGPIDRDEVIDGQLGMFFGFDIAVFGELAEALADAGYVVLRYDKRSCTVQTGCQNAYPPLSGTGLVDDYVTDLKAGLDWLRTRAEVDTERLYYVGHSQGAQFAPELLASRSDLKAAVMLAGPYGSVDELIAVQARFLRELVISLGGSTADPSLLALEQGMLELQQLRQGTFTGNVIMGSATAQWQSWMDLGDRARSLVHELDRPLLALSGDYDWNVPPSETDAWRDAFAALADNPGHEAVVLPCVSHALNCISQPELALVTEADFGRHIEPAVTAEVVRFLGLHGGLPGDVHGAVTAQ